MESRYRLGAIEVESVGGNIMVGRRHASDEIATKLAQAHELAAKGKTQREISKALGVSIMTFHRWKKLAGSSDGPRNTDGAVEPELRMEAVPPGTEASVRRLELENSRLRKLVTDLLLEKLSLEEELGARQVSKRPHYERTK
jgi:hypothetical protein